jgi:hypothetical protein
MDVNNRQKTKELIALSKKREREEKDKYDSSALG